MKDTAIFCEKNISKTNLEAKIVEETIKKKQINSTEYKETIQSIKQTVKH